MQKARNAKFAITSKSGQSSVMEFASYVEAQRYADSHYGKGCIVKLVGNAACSTNSVVRNAVMAVNYTMIGGRGRPMVHTDDDTVGELMLGLAEIKRRTKFGDEASERENGQKLKALFEAKRFKFYDKASARELEKRLLDEWNRSAKSFKLQGL